MWNENLTDLQNGIISIVLAVALIIGVIWGLSGKKFKWEKPLKKYLLIATPILIIATLIIMFVKG